MAALLQQTDDPVCLVSGFVSFVEGQLTLEPRVMMTKPVPGAGRRNYACGTATFCQRFACAVYCSSVADTLRALLIQLLHNGWRYQNRVLLVRQSCWRMTSPRWVLSAGTCVGTIS